MVEKSSSILVNIGALDLQVLLRKFDSSRHFYSSLVAQWLEHYPVTVGAAGSNPV